MTPERLAETVTCTEPGWPGREDFPLAQCLGTDRKEEREHRLYAERDLDAWSAPPGSHRERL